MTNPKPDTPKDWVEETLVDVVGACTKVLTLRNASRSPQELFDLLQPDLAKASQTIRLNILKEKVAEVKAIATWGQKDERIAELEAQIKQMEE